MFQKVFMRSLAMKSADVLPMVLMMGFLFTGMIGLLGMTKYVEVMEKAAEDQTAAVAKLETAVSVLRGEIGELRGARPALLRAVPIGRLEEAK